VATLTAALTAARQQTATQTAELAATARARREAERRLRDRDEELRGKAKLVEEAQDEMVSLQLQVNMAEQRAEGLRRENEELVARWMKRMGEEAERVNRDAGWE
jgi:hypothetical protein